MHTAAVSPNPIVKATGKMLVGVSDFTELVQEGYCFVDKTLFTKELLDSGDKLSLINRPRRFGKNINLNIRLRHSSPRAVLSLPICSTLKR